MLPNMPCKIEGCGGIGISHIPLCGTHAKWLDPKTLKKLQSLENIWRENPTEKTHEIFERSCGMCIEIVRLSMANPQNVARGRPPNRAERRRRDRARRKNRGKMR